MQEVNTIRDTQVTGRRMRVVSDTYDDKYILAADLSNVLRMSSTDRRMQPENRVVVLHNNRRVYAYPFKIVRYMDRLLCSQYIADVIAIVDESEGKTSVFNALRKEFEAKDREIERLKNLLSTRTCEADRLRKNNLELKGVISNLKDMFVVAAGHRPEEI